MRRRRVSGRFYVFLLLVATLAFFIIRNFLPQGVKEAVVTLATTDDTRTVEAVIVRDETVGSFEGNGRVTYVAPEGMLVNQGDEIAYVYSAGYSEKEIAKLETVRQDIRHYHQTILANIVDRELERLDENVDAKALELKTLVNRKATGSLNSLERQLENAMLERQEYLRQNRREDPKLNQLYEEESRRVTSIASWKKTETAPASGIVSFYLDGCERFLNPANLDSITPEDLRNILNGATPDMGDGAQIVQQIYRLVKTDKWYVLALSRDPEWNPVSGQTFRLQLEGFEDVVYNATVEQIQKSGDETMVQLSITDPIGPLINQRSGQAVLGTSLEGLLVPLGALVDQGGQSGVMVSDVTGGSFVPVNVLSRGSKNALVSPLVEGTLSSGQHVLTK